MTMCKAQIPYCRVAGHVVILAAVLGMSGCIPTDNSLMRTALYVLVLQRASHGALLANRGPLKRDDCERSDQLYFACRYSDLTAFLTPAAERAVPVRSTVTEAGANGQNVRTDVSSAGTDLAVVGNDTVDSPVVHASYGINTVAASSRSVKPM